MNRASEGLALPLASRLISAQRASWVQIAILGLLISFLYYQILGSLVDQWWRDPDFSHGFFVPLFSAFVIWQRKHRLSSLLAKPSWVGLVVIAGAMVVLVAGVMGAELFLSRSSLLLLLAGLVIYFLGGDYFRAILFPWAFLFFMIPIPKIIFNQITFPLQFLASRLASSLLSLAGVPVLRDGNVIQLPAMVLEIAEACSGIRSLLSLVALAVIYGYLLERKSGPRALLVLAAVPIAVVANGLRIMGTGLLGQYWNPDKAMGFFHEFSGWVIFVSSLLMLFCLHGAMHAAHHRFGARKT